MYQIKNTNAFKSLWSISFKFAFPLKLFSSKLMVTARYCLLKSSPWCSGNTGFGPDLVTSKQVSGIIMESSRYLRWADLYQVGRYSTWITWNPSGAMAEGQKCDCLQSLTWPWALHQWQGRATSGSWCFLGGAGCPWPGCSQSLLCQPGLHGHLGDATAPKVMLGPKGSTAAFSPKRKRAIKICLLSKTRMLHSPHPWHTETSRNLAQVQQINCHCARESLQYPQWPKHSWEKRFQPALFTASRN